MYICLYQDSFNLHYVIKDIILIPYIYTKNIKSLTNNHRITNINYSYWKDEFHFHTAWVVWWYGSRYFGIFCHTAAGLTDCGWDTWLSRLAPMIFWAAWIWLCRTCGISNQKAFYCFSVKVGENLAFSQAGETTILKRLNSCFVKRAHLISLLVSGAGGEHQHEDEGGPAHQRPALLSLG